MEKETFGWMESLEAALWYLMQEESYEEAILLAVNLGYDTDTVSAIAGRLVAGSEEERMGGRDVYWLIIRFAKIYFRKASETS